MPLLITVATRAPPLSATRYYFMLTDYVLCHADAFFTRDTPLLARRFTLMLRYAALDTPCFHYDVAFFCQLLYGRRHAATLTRRLRAILRMRDTLPLTPAACRFSMPPCHAEQRYVVFIVDYYADVYATVSRRRYAAFHITLYVAA